MGGAMETEDGHCVCTTVTYALPVLYDVIVYVVFQLNLIVACNLHITAHRQMDKIWEIYFDRAELSSTELEQVYSLKKHHKGVFPCPGSIEHCLVE